WVARPYPMHGYRGTGSLFLGPHASEAPWPLGCLLINCRHSHMLQSMVVRAAAAGPTTGCRASSKTNAIEPVAVTKRTERMDRHCGRDTVSHCGRVESSAAGLHRMQK